LSQWVLKLILLVKLQASTIEQKAVWNGCVVIVVVLRNGVYGKKEKRKKNEAVF